MALQTAPTPTPHAIAPKSSILARLGNQFPAIVVTVVVTAGIILGAGYWFWKKADAENDAKQRRTTDTLREQYAVELRASGEETRRQIEAMNAILKDAIQKRAADVLMTETEFAQVNAGKVNQLAEAIAAKIQPYNPLPKTPEEADKIQNEQIDKVSSRMADKIQPILAEMSREQHLTRDSLVAYSQKISDQIGTMLTAELAKNQQLNNSVVNTQSIARDSLRLSQEVSALYLASFKDQGLITRLLSLPANVIKDATSMSIVNSAERKKVEERLFAKMGEIERRLNEAQAQLPKK